MSIFPNVPRYRAGARGRIVRILQQDLSASEDTRHAAICASFVRHPWSAVPAPCIEPSLLECCIGAQN